MKVELSWFEKVTAACISEEDPRILPVERCRQVFFSWVSKERCWIIPVLLIRRKAWADVEKILAGNVNWGLASRIGIASAIPSSLAVSSVLVGGTGDYLGDTYQYHKTEDLAQLHLICIILLLTDYWFKNKKQVPKDSKSTLKYISSLLNKLLAGIDSLNYSFKNIIVKPWKNN